MLEIFYKGDCSGGLPGLVKIFVWKITWILNYKYRPLYIDHAASHVVGLRKSYILA
jgi:hypothetical protein